MNGGEYKDIEFLEIFENCAQKLMFQWNSKGFQKKFSTLYKVIQITGTAYKKLLSDKYEAEKLRDKKDAEDAKKEKDIKDTSDTNDWSKFIEPKPKEQERHVWIRYTSDTKPPVHGKGFARRPGINGTPYCQKTLNYVYYTAKYGTPRMQDCAIEYIVTHQRVITTRKIKAVPYFSLKPHRNIRRHRCTK